MDLTGSSFKAFHFKRYFEERHMFCDLKILGKRREYPKPRQPLYHFPVPVFKYFLITYHGLLSSNCRKHFALFRITKLSVR